MRFLIYLVCLLFIFSCKDSSRQIQYNSKLVRNLALQLDARRFEYVLQDLVPAFLENEGIVSFQVKSDRGLVTVSVHPKTIEAFVKYIQEVAAHLDKSCGSLIPGFVPKNDITGKPRTKEQIIASSKCRRDAFDKFDKMALRRLSDFYLSKYESDAGRGCASETLGEVKWECLILGDEYRIDRALGFRNVFHLINEQRLFKNSPDSARIFREKKVEGALK